MVANPEKGPENPHKKAKTTHPATESNENESNYFYSDILKGLENAKNMVNKKVSTVKKSRYNDDRSFSDYVLENFLNMYAPEAPSSSISTSLPSIIPQKRASSQLAQKEEIIEPEIVSYNPPLQFESAQDIAGVEVNFLEELDPNKITDLENTSTNTQLIEHEMIETEEQPEMFDTFQDDIKQVSDILDSKCTDVELTNTNIQTIVNNQINDIGSDENDILVDKVIDNSIQDLDIVLETNGNDDVEEMVEMQELIEVEEVEEEEEEIDELEDSSSEDEPESVEMAVESTKNIVNHSSLEADDNSDNDQFVDTSDMLLDFAEANDNLNETTDILQDIHENSEDDEFFDVNETFRNDNSEAIQFDVNEDVQSAVDEIADKVVDKVVNEIMDEVMDEDIRSMVSEQMIIEAAIASTASDNLQSTASGNLFTENRYADSLQSDANKDLRLELASESSQQTLVKNSSALDLENMELEVPEVSEVMESQDLQAMDVYDIQSIDLSSLPNLVDIEEELTSSGDSLVVNLVQNQLELPSSLDESDELVEEYQEPIIKAEGEPNINVNNVHTSNFIELNSDQCSNIVFDEEEDDGGNISCIGLSSIEDEDDIETENIEDEMEIEDVQTQQAVALPLDDIPLDCLDSSNNNTRRTFTSLIVSSLPKISIWWYDAHDSNKNGVVFLFGKVFDDQLEKYVSCCVRVKNISRELYILPRKYKIDDEGNPTNKLVALEDVQQELESLLEHKRISTHKMSICNKKYAFSANDVPKEATYIKLNYSYKDYEFPTSQTGKTFSHVFGTNTSPLEHFLIHNDIMGPCWLELNNPYPLGNDLSWCLLNIGLENPEDCSVKQGDQEIPPLNVLSLSLQTKMSRLSQTNEIVAASIYVCKDVNIHTLDYIEGLNGIRCTIISLPPNISYPEDAVDIVETKGSDSKHDIQLENTEFGLLNRLLAAIHVHDPDIISGHNFFGGDLDILLTRMKDLNISHWHKLGRIKSKSTPRISGNSVGSISSTYYQRLHMRGRIVCDTFEASRDLIKSKSYHLSELAKTQLDVIREDIKPQELDMYYKSGASIVRLAKHCSLDAYLSFAIMAKLQILPLTKQLTNLAGNLWSRSIHGARSERNEYLLLHTFYKKGYICPDKSDLQKKHSFEFVDEALELELPAAKRQNNANGKNSSFEGGLVLEPKIGIYDKYVLLLDFNSLYPSIMQEYNVCFTTMALHGDENGPEILPSQETIGILPELVKMFVDRRKNVKLLMNEPELSKSTKAQYHIEQMGLKLTANSMYGCLGSSYSRFFAKPLAAFITGKGREILRKTVDMAEQSNLDVIYGDTDSIMINTNQTVFSKANMIGEKLKTKVNLQYKMLEIDIDGVFKRTLLLRKKKYAAKVVTKQANGLYRELLEVKGLDLIRRDGCDLSRSTSEYVLQLVLMNNPGDIIVNSIHEYMRMVADKVHSSKIPVNDYIIRKQLTKSPEEYRTAKGNPHVTVAKDMRRSGIAVKAGDTIPYIYCIKNTPDGDSREPRMPDDVHSGKAEIDKTWYLLKQVLPAVDRICIPLEGTDRNKLIECLQINNQEPPNLNEMDEMGVEEIEEDDDISEPEPLVTKSRHCKCESLKFKCAACNHTITYKESNNGSGLACVCGEPLNSASAYSQTLITTRRFIKMYYDSPYQCSEPSCGFQTKDQLPNDNESCLQYGCPGRLVRQYSARKLYDQISLFAETSKKITQNQQADFTAISNMLEEILKNSSFKYISFASFM